MKKILVLVDATETAEKAVGQAIALAKRTQASISLCYVARHDSEDETEALKAYVAEFPPALVARNQLENAVAEFSTFETARVRDGLNSAIQSALTGAKEPAEALAEAQAAAVRLLSDYQ